MLLQFEHKPAHSFSTMMLSTARSSRQLLRQVSRRSLATAKPPPRPLDEVGDADFSHIVVDSQTKLKNIAMAGGLFAFCFGVAWYSMNSVGQAGSSADDPLAALRLEAAEAQAVRDQEASSTDSATQMLQQFQKGEYDPDRYDEEEEQPKRKRPWYKFW